ncbi:MAG: inositol monophosphatase family protein [Bacteroidales bacterium]|nr:inositol monophosphatase family protein [Bacteroidales bacterium]
MENYGNLCMSVCSLCEKTADYIRGEALKLKTSDVEIKGMHNFVTYVDKTAEKKLVEALQSLLPSAGFIVEENTIEKKSADYNWIIDPLDGTTNFIHGIPCYCISIALMSEKEIVLGVIYEINLKECFYAWKGSPAFLNAKEIHVSKSTKIVDSLLATGFPYYDYKHLDPYLDFFKYLILESRGVRRLGSAAVDLAYVACGRFDGFYEYSLNPWDVAAGSFIVEQAGGKVCDFSGKDNFIFGQEIIAANPFIINSLLSNLQHFFKIDKQ